MDEITLYHGNNGVHEFYESEEQPRILIIRLHREGAWIVIHAFREHVHSEYNAGPLASVIREVAERTGIRINVDPSREWRSTGKRRMTLEPAA